jgi:hypothetical protein
MKKARWLRRRKLYVLTTLVGYPYIFLVFWLKNRATREQLPMIEIALFAAIGVGCVLISFAWKDFRKH